MIEKPVTKQWGTPHSLQARMDIQEGNGTKVDPDFLVGVALLYGVPLLDRIALLDVMALLEPHGEKGPKKTYPDQH